MFTGPLEGGDGMWLASSGGGPSLADAGYREAEYAAGGTATSYVRDGELPTDGVGRWSRRARRRTTRPASSCAGPSDPRALQRHRRARVAQRQRRRRRRPRTTRTWPTSSLRGGYAWVGVSAQHIGVEGGPVAVEVPGAEATGAWQGPAGHRPGALRRPRPPGDAYSYDIFTQVARALRSAGRRSIRSTGSRSSSVLAVGESQSAFALTTYVNGVQPLTEQFDGFLIHSRGEAAAAARRRRAGGIDVAGASAGRRRGSAPTATRR